MSNRVADVIISQPYSAAIREIAAACVEAYIERFKDDRAKVVATELTFYMLLDEATLVVGACDRITDEDGIVVTELKTKGAPKVKKDGTPYEGSSQQEWMTELINSIQCKVYALAASRATYVHHDGRQQTFNAAHPRVRVRAVNKPNPLSRGFEQPVVWTVNEDRPFSYPSALLEHVEGVLIRRAAGIRAMRRLGGPWALPSHHCTNKFRRVCEFLPDCLAGRPLSGSTPRGLSAGDPANAVLAHAGVDLENPDLVIFSASSFAEAMWCDERYRRMAASSAEEESEALAIGTVFHAACAEWERERIGA